MARKEQDKSEYTISSYRTQVAVSIEDINKRGHMNLVNSFGRIKYENKVYDITQSGAQFFIRLPGTTKEAVVDIGDALNDAVKQLALLKD